MKLQSATRDVQSSGIQQTANFQIAATAKAFKILSDGLYSNKIGAIVRELSTNAYDAHISAGKPDVPFDIRVPTPLDLTLAIRDYGLGLPHEFMMKNAVTFFFSDKVDSNDVNGCLGLGMKSPFGYVSQYSVISRHEGMKRAYCCYLNAAGAPDISLLSEEPSDEPSGLELIIPVGERDYHKFVNECANQLKWFTPLPNFSSHVNIQYPTVRMRGDSYNLYEVGANRGWTVVQGVVGYPLDTASILEHLTPTAKLLAQYGAGVLFVPIGSCDIAASREALSYDKSTIAYLTQRMEKVAFDFFSELTKSIDSAPTHWEAMSLLAQARKALPSQLQDMLKVAKYKGKKLEVEWAVPIEHAIVDEFWSDRKTNKLKWEQRLNLVLNAGSAKLIFVRDVNDRLVSRLDEFIRPHKIAGYVIHPEDLDKLPPGFPEAQIIRLSSIEPPRTERVSREAYRRLREAQRARVPKNGYDGPLSVDNRTWPVQANPTHGYYVVTEANCTTALVAHAIGAEHLVPGQVYLVQKTAENIVKKLPLKPYMPAFLDALRAVEKDTVDRYQRRVRFYGLPNYVYTTLETLTVPVPDRATKPFWQMYKALASHRNLPWSNQDAGNYSLICENFGEPQNNYDFAPIVKKFESEAPLLKQVLSLTCDDLEEGELKTVIDRLS